LFWWQQSPCGLNPGSTFVAVYLFIFVLCGDWNTSGEKKKKKKKKKSIVITAGVLVFVAECDGQPCLWYPKCYVVANEVTVALKKQIQSFYDCVIGTMIVVIV
jgi:hypothetical protein